MTDIAHLFAAQLVARDQAVARTLDQQISALRDTCASQIAAFDAAKAERVARHNEQIDFLERLHEAENAAADTQREAVVAAFRDEIDRLTMLAAAIEQGQLIMPATAPLVVSDSPGATRIDAEAIVGEAAAPESPAA